MLTTIPKSETVRTLLDLACPYLYRREGRYTLRVRPMGSKASLTLSLKTTHRQTALATAAHLLKTLRAFHLDRPDASWPELKANLRAIAEDVLQTRSVWDQLGGAGRVYADVREDLNEIASTEPLSVPQARTVEMGRQLMVAAERRTEGFLAPIVGLIEELKEADEHVVISTTAPVAPPQGGPVVTFEALASLYMDERREDLKESSMRSVKTCCETLSAVLGDKDMATHSRADLIAARESLKEGRKAVTVNKIITQLTTILSWAVDNGHIKQAFCKKLQILKGTESERTAFTRDQVETLMAHANSLPADSWHRWALTLGVITGARVGEIQQLTTEDIIEDGAGGVLVMDINTSGGKTLKNKFSARKVPLVSALGVDLEAFKAYAESSKGRLFSHTAAAFTAALNQRIRDVLGIGTKTGQSFHSLRHHLAGALKAAEVPLGTAQEILGHSSGSITFDLYGAGSAVQVGRMAEALKSALADS